MSTHEIKVERREDGGKGASRRLRHAAKIPAIVYGGGIDPVNIQLDHEKVWLASQNEWFYSSILDLSLDGQVQKVLLRDMQRHPYRQLIMHLDFQRVNENETIRASVPVHLVNVDTSPAGKTAGVVVTQELNEIEVLCLPGKLPENIEVDLGNMSVGDTVHMSDVVFPEGVQPATAIDESHNPAVAVARHARVEVADETEEGAEGDKAE